MADVQFDIALKNTGSATEGLTLFAPVDSASQKSNKYSFTTPYTSNYPQNTIFTILDSAGSNQITLDAPHTMSEVCILLSSLNAGTFILGFNDAINGNVFHLLSMRTPQSLSIDGNVATFNIVQTTDKHPSSSICFPDASTVIISADQGILRSTDDGLTYSYVAFPSSVGYTIYQVQFFDASNGFATGYNAGSNDSNIWKTVNGGLSWTLVSTQALLKITGIWMFDANNGLLCEISGSFPTQLLVIHQTSDGGVTISVKVSPSQNTDTNIAFLDFVNTNLGRVVFPNLGVWIFRTNNAFATYGNYPAIGYNSGGSYLDATHLWMVDRNPGIDNHKLKFSANGGTTFSIITTPYTVHMVQAISALELLVTFEGNMMWGKSLDGGVTWTVFPVGGSGSLTALFRSLTMGVAHNGSTNIYRY